MNQQELFVYIIQKLNKVNVAYMITGAYAVSYHGKPRATHDIDLKINLQLKDVELFYNNFRQDEFYIDKEMIKDAIIHKSQFNIIHLETNIKIDFWLLGDSEYDRTRFSRRQKVELFGEEVFVPTAEDAILIKLQWYKDSKIEKHLSDAEGIFKLQRNSLDIKYTEQWAEKLSVVEFWEAIKKEELP